MKKSSYMIGIAAILLAAAFALVGVSNVDADAIESPTEEEEELLTLGAGDQFIVNDGIQKTTIKVVKSEDHTTDAAAFDSETRTLTIKVNESNVSAASPADPDYISWAIAESDKIKLTLDDATKTDCDFKDWTVVAGSATAEWLVQPVKYVCDPVNTIKTQNVFEDKITLMNFSDVFPNIDKTHFLGWEIGGTTYTEGSAVKVAEAGVLSEPQLEVKAKFTMYDVVYKDAATEVKANAPVIPGTEITLLAEDELDTQLSYTPTENQFIGWNIAGDATKTLYAPESKYTVTGDVTFVAAYNSGYVITFVAGDTSTTKTTLQLDADEDGICVAVPSKVGHSFAGWYDAAGVMAFTAEGKETEPAYVFTADTTLTAKFTPNNMTVTFVVGDFTSKQTVLYGQCAMMPALPEGYDAWIGADGEEFDFKAPITEDTTVTAREAAVEPEPEVTAYNVTFIIEGKEPVMQKSDSLNVPNTYREGYNFKGWLANGSATYVDPMKYEYTADVTFVAVYEEATPAEPGFFETATGKCVIIIVIFALGLIVYKGFNDGKFDGVLGKLKNGGKKE